VQQEIAKQVAENMAPAQTELRGLVEMPNITTVVAKTTEIVVQQTIDIPRILVVPRGEVTTGFHSFKLECAGIHYQPVERDLLIQHLRTHAQETVSIGGNLERERRLEDYLIRGLIDFDDISYDEHADLLYELASQMVAHLRSYLSEDDTRNVLIYHQKQLAAFIHAQMQTHQWEKAAGYEVVVSKGFSELKSSAYTAKANEPIYDFHQTPQDKSRIAQMLFNGFQRCLYSVQKFQSDSERKLAIILDREVQKWFKPAQGQFQIFYKLSVDHREYVPDFVAETDSCIYILEPKARNEMTSVEVLAKRDVATRWCDHATSHALRNGGKPWKYILIPHDAIAENMTLAGLVSQFGTDLGVETALAT
jgi:type III restriction enzyme